jgi:hypothetical protein
MIQQHVISLLATEQYFMPFNFLCQPTLYRKTDAMNNSKQPPLAILFPQPGNIDVSPFSRDSLLAFFLTDNKYAGKHAVSSIPRISTLYLEGSDPKIGDFYQFIRRLDPGICVECQTISLSKIDAVS